MANVLEGEILARRRELVQTSAGLQRARARVRLDRLEQGGALAFAIGFGRRILTRQVLFTVATLLARRLIVGRTR